MLRRAGVHTRLGQTSLAPVLVGDGNRAFARVGLGAQGPEGSEHAVEVAQEPVEPALEVVCNALGLVELCEHGVKGGLVKVCLFRAFPQSLVPPQADQPSPTKRRRLAPAFSSADAPSSASSARQLPLRGPQSSHADFESPLAPLPAPVALLATAVSLRAAAQALLPSLAKRPSSSSSSSQTRYAQAWAEYVRAATAAIVVLRAAVHLTAAASEWSGGRIELRANAMLAETLVDLYDGSGNEKAVAPEADKAVARALAISQSHPSLATYSPPLSLLHLRLSLFSSKPLKYIRTTLRRLVTSLPALTPSPSSPPPSAASAAATYAAHAFTASVPGATRAEALSAWQTVRELAAARGDDQVRVVAALAEARLALEAEDYRRAGALLGALRETFDPAAAAADRGDGLRARWAPRLLDVQYRLLDCLHTFQTGEAKTAKEALKATHKVLDAVANGVAGSEREGDEVTTVVGAGGSSGAAALQFKIAAQSALYPFAFLASAAIHLDPQGKMPRAQLFGEEGIRLAEQKLNGREVSHPVTSLPSISTSLRRTAALKARLHALLASLATMRSDYHAAEAHLFAALHLARVYAPPGVASPDGVPPLEAGARAALAWALVRAARAARDGADEREAARALEAVVAACDPDPDSNSDPDSPAMAHLGRIARLSLLILRQSAPSLSPSPSASPAPPLISSATLARVLSPASVPGGASASAPARLIAALAGALTVQSITQSKTALSQALSLTNTMQATHARAGVLALLANVFLWTREGEAQKMLHSALRLASSFGAPATRTTRAGVPVGHARLSLWLGERLAESYRAQTQMQVQTQSQQPADGAHIAAELLAAQERANAACREMLAQEAREAAATEGEGKDESARAAVKMEP
ncbi:hypothetical protein JCM3770_000765 [Rhodotorula araucariae]